MKNRILNLGIFAILLGCLTSCELIGDIFEAGMAVGVIIVVAVIVLILWLISKFRK